MTQTNVKIRTDTKKRLKLLAIEQDTTLQELIQKAIDQYLEKSDVNEKK